MEYVLVTTMVVALTDFVKAGFDRNYRAMVIIAGAAVIGGVCGFFGVEGLDVARGIVVGLSAAGVVTVAKRI